MLALAGCCAKHGGVGARSAVAKDVLELVRSGCCAQIVQAHAMIQSHGVNCLAGRGWMATHNAWCYLCQGTGVELHRDIETKTVSYDPLTSCSGCDGTRRDPIPWTELFRRGRALSGPASLFRNWK